MAILPINVNSTSTRSI